MGRKSQCYEFSAGQSGDDVMPRDGFPLRQLLSADWPPSGTGRGLPVSLLGR